MSTPSTSPTKNKTAVAAPPPTTENARNAIAKLSGDLELNDLPSIGEATLKALVKEGISSYWLLFAQFLQRGPTGFRTWLDSITSNHVSHALKDELVIVLQNKLEKYKDV